MIADTLRELTELLDIASSNADRAEALSLFLGADDEFARFLAARAHVIVRGGTRALLREMLSTVATPNAEISVYADIAEQYLAGRDVGVRFVRVATTRAPASRRRLTLETHAHEVGGVHFAPDGSIIAFVSGLIGWDPAHDESFNACIARWDATTGRFLGAAKAGQFREGDGAMGVNPSGTTVVVRSHRNMTVHAIRDGQVEPREASRIHIDEGPHQIQFLDERMILSNNAYELVIADTETGAMTRNASTIGRAFVFSPQHRRVFVGGALPSNRLIAIHDYEARELDMLGRVFDPTSTGKNRPFIETMALSPAEDVLATGDWANEVRLWSVEEVMRAGVGGNGANAVSLGSKALGKHRAWVSASAFIDDARLLTAAWDGALIEWNVERREAAHRMHEHCGRISALALAPDRKRAATGASDGKIVLWDLDAEPAAAPPPFVIAYGSHALPLTMMLRGEEIRIALGTWETFFDRRGKLLRAGECVAPEGYKGAPYRHQEVEGFVHEDLGLEGFDRPEAEWACGMDAPSIVVSRDDEVLDILGLDAPVIAFTWVDEDSFVVLDSAGHVELWSRRDH